MTAFISPTAETLAAPTPGDGDPNGGYKLATQMFAFTAATASVLETGSGSTTPTVTVGQFLPPPVA